MFNEILQSRFLYSIGNFQDNLKDFKSAILRNFLAEATISEDPLLALVWYLLFDGFTKQIRQPLPFWGFCRVFGL